MKGINRIQWCSVVLLAFSLTACKVKRPETVLPDAKMENVLYDYHIAKAMGEEVPYNESYKRVLYIESVFKKYGITQADFDSSMVWFARNPEVLTKIYEKVNVRLKAERDGINHLIALRDNKPKESLPGDSIDVWIWQHIYQLTGMPLDNKITFTLPSDTNFHDRDTLRWSARFRFHNGAPDSIHAPLMVMQVLYEKNDSVISAMGEEVPYNESYKRVLYIESVFKKYGITQADFDSSMVWFARNPEVLTKIYEKVNVRLKAERDGINHLIALRDNKPKESLPGDSIDVWIWQHIYQLTGMPLDNKITFTLPSDTNFHDRDTLRWSARFRFHNGAPDSIHAPLMVMQVLYEKNDSVISAIRKVQGTGVETLTLFADTLGEIKEIRGFIYYPQQETPQPLLADRISLMRYHATDSLVIAPKDSLQQATDSLRKDSIGKPEKLKPLKIQEQENATTPRTIRPRPKA